MDRILALIAAMVEAMGIVIFIVVAMFALAAGAVYQFFFAPARKKPAPIPPPITPQVEQEAEKAGGEVSIQPGQTSVDFFNDLAKK